MQNACGYSFVKCIKCADVYAIFANISHDVTVSGYAIKPVPIKEDIPPLPIGSFVTIRNENHQKNGQTGTIVNKNHRRYRVEFDDKIMLWLPDHWVLHDNSRDRH